MTLFFFSTLFQLSQFEKLIVIMKLIKYIFGHLQTSYFPEHVQKIVSLGGAVFLWCGLISSCSDQSLQTWQVIKPTYHLLGHMNTSQHNSQNSVSPVFPLFHSTETPESVWHIHTPLREKPASKQLQQMSHFFSVTSTNLQQTTQAERWHLFWSDNVIVQTDRKGGVTLVIFRVNNISENKLTQ